MSRPSGVVRSRARLRLPRLECSSSACTSPPMEMTPVAARPRMASPRSVGSTLITSAPQSASSAEAAGTNVCSATSRIRTPFMTAVALTAPLPLLLTSTSILGGGHLEHHFAHGLPVAHHTQGLRGFGQVVGGADDGPGAPAGQELEQFGVVARHVGGHVRGEVPELEPEHAYALQQHQIKRYPRDRPRCEPDRDE